MRFLKPSCGPLGRIESIKIPNEDCFNFLSLFKFFFGSCDSLIVIKSLQHFGCRLGYPLLIFRVELPESGAKLFYLGSLRSLLYADGDEDRHRGAQL